MSERNTVDLHVHSTASDGTETPSALIAEAEEKGLAALALCDHETVSGLEEFEAAARGKNVRAVPGIEIATRLFQKEVHLLGLFIDRSAEALREPLAKLRRLRRDRNALLLARLQAGGYGITADDVAEFSAGESPGRPHFARALVEKGFFESVPEAFARCLRQGTEFYVPRVFLPLEEIIRMIHESGGLAVWAHPIHSGHSGRSFLRKFLKRLTSCGLDAVEAYYPLFPAAYQKTVLAVAAEMNLLVSGGSDYHGRNQPDISMGTGYGNWSVPRSVFENLEKAHLERRGISD